MLDKVEKFINAHRLLTPYTTVVVGFSGGADSMALLDVLTLLNYRCIAAHCNFHLRGEESDEDARFVKNFCKDSDIEFTSVDFDTRQYAKDRKISIEMAARELRYDWFEIICKQYDAEAIAVAHHRDDSIETVLLNLIRGTGIHGLSGISPRNGKILRPFLSVSRAEILNYLTERGLPFRHDSSNFDDIFLRNAIRLRLLPTMEEFNPSVRDAIFRTSQHLAEAEEVYNYAIEQFKPIVFDGNKIAIEPLKSLPSLVSILFEILSPFGFSPSVIEDIADSLESSSGKQFFSEKWRLVKDRDFFILSEKQVSNGDDFYLIEEDDMEITSPIRLKINRLPVSSPIKKDTKILYADAQKIVFPIKLRRWRSGDWFVPFGMSGKKKLSDYFSDNKFSLPDKENTWLLVSDESIVWIVGQRSDERFKVSEKTTEILTIELLDE